jgi:chromosome segregation ATPase
VEVFSTYVSIDTMTGKSAPVRVPETPLSLPRRQPRPVAPTSDGEGAAEDAGEYAEPLSGVEYGSDEWSDAFARTLQSQHARIRDFLESRNDRWRQVVARCERQIEQLQSEVAELAASNDGLREKAGELTASNDGLREQASELSRSNDGLRDQAAELRDQATGLREQATGLREEATELREQAATSIRHEPREESRSSTEPSQDYLDALDEINQLKSRNSDLQRQLREANSAPRRASAAALPADTGTDWESQKRRLLAELEADDGAVDAKSNSQRIEINEIISRTDRIIAEKDREIAELKHLLDSQTGSLGGLAVGAAALEEVFSQDDIIREERQRLQQAQEELREKLRHAEVTIATERATIARREAELEERLRAEPQNGSSEKDGEALAPTGRPVRGRWRSQLGLGDDSADERRR